MKDDYTIGEDDWIDLDDVAMVAHSYRTAQGSSSKHTHKAYRDWLIRRCCDQGNVTRSMPANAAHLSLTSLSLYGRTSREVALAYIFAKSI